jgi:hypothetical protein
VRHPIEFEFSDKLFDACHPFVSLAVIVTTIRARRSFSTFW